MNTQNLVNQIKTTAFGLLAALAVLSASTAQAQVMGPIAQEETVLARDTDVYKVTFRGGRVGRVSVIGDGDTDLDLYVFDRFGNLVAYDDDLTDTCVVEWWVSRTGEYTIFIENLGRVYNDYVLLTN